MLFDRVPDKCHRRRPLGHETFNLEFEWISSDKQRAICFEFVREPKTNKIVAYLNLMEYDSRIPDWMILGGAYDAFNNQAEFQCFEWLEKR